MNILFTYRGSVAQNLKTNGDEDFGVVDLYPVDFYIGMDQDKPTKEPEKDEVHWEFRHFVRLLCKNNPDMLSLLWNKPEMYIYLHKYGEILIQNRDIFASKLVRKHTKGYALNEFGIFLRKGEYKHACHSVRLLKMGLEFFETGLINPFRKDRDYLIDIKNGEYDQNYLKTIVSSLSYRLDQACDQSNLPEYPDYDKINTMVKYILGDYLCGR